MTLTFTQCLSGVFTIVKGETFMSYNGGVSFRSVRNSDAFRSCINVVRPQQCRCSALRMLGVADGRILG